MKNILPLNKNVIFRPLFSQIFGILLPLIVIFTLTAPVFAVGSFSFGAVPTNSSENDPRTKSWFIYSYSAGEKRNDSVTVSNNGSETVTLKVYPVDSTTTSDGSFALANENAPRKNVGKWVTLSTDEVTLAPNEKKVIPFLITIPQQTTKGEYSGGIVFENTVPQNFKKKNVNLNVISRMGVRIYETVPGPEQLNMEISALDYSIVNNYLNFSFILKNTGAVNVSPTGMLQVKDIFGRIINTIPLEEILDVSTPGQSTKIEIPTKILSPILGWNTVNVAVYYSPTKAAVADLTFMPNSRSAFVLIFIILAIIALLFSRKYLVHTDKKTHKTVLAPHIMIIVGLMLLGILMLSGLFAYLLKSLI